MLVDQLLHALPLVLEWQNFLAMIGGTIMGICLGALPGLGATVGIALLIPLTFGVQPLLALGMMAGIYNGAMYGGAIPAILLRVPGTPAAICTTLDGYPMAQRGDAVYALQVAVLSSCLGGVVSSIALMTMAPPLAQVALAFGPAEIFWTAFFGLSSIAVLLGDDPVKGLMSSCFGLLIGCVGVDLVTGHERFTFDSINLVGGLNSIVVLTGLFALPPAFEMAEKAMIRGYTLKAIELKASRGMFSGCRELWPAWTRGSIIGIIMGIVPGAGGNIAAIVAYNEQKRMAKDPDSYGNGNPAGIAAAESANNADNSAALIPALTLGVPGSVVAAVILGGLTVHGLQPGPSLFRDAPDVVFGFMIQMLLTSLMLLPLGGMFFSRLFAQVLRIPPILLVTMIVALTVVGIYSVNNSMFDVYLMLSFGVVGHLMERLHIPLAPVALGVILGPMAETNLRLALRISLNNVSGLVSSSISKFMIGLIVLVLVYSFVQMRRKRAAA